MTSAAQDRTGDSLELAAPRLAEDHALADRPPKPAPCWSEVADLADWLVRARAALAEPEGRVSKAAEWLLDNEYLVHRAVRQIQEDLPTGFYRQLPALANGSMPRVLVLARGLLHASQLQLSLATVNRFTQAYQNSATLTTAELWAFPTMLRLGCLEVLVGAMEALLPSLPAPFEVPREPQPSLEETESVARAIGNLRVIATISWKDFFEGASRVHAVLRKDPVGIYSRMDFETADRYRDGVERLARATTHSEIEVAERVVAFAGRFAGSDPRRGHVGHWLVDAGQEEFERSLSYRAPLRLRLQRGLSRHGAGAYALGLATATLVALALPLAYLAHLEAAPGVWIAMLAVTALPASTLGVTVVHWIVTQVLAPRVLPKLDLEDGIPLDCKTAVVVPCLAGHPSEVDELVERLETHYLGNPEAAVEFVLLSDFPDSATENRSEDTAVLEALATGIARLNRQYAGGDAGPFHVLHRPRLWNPAERCWMGWERKRGKLEDFNRLLRGGPSSSFSLHAGDDARLGGTQFVVTLDVDTVLPRGALQRLVGILAHPLNRAEFDESGRVAAGYTVVQPRVEVDPGSGNRSRFARLFAGDTAIDIYSRAVSDVYQDLLGAGIYVGKGIYDVNAFHESLEGRVPENALASHDLFEGIHGRAALATDVVLYESFPGRYLEFTRRMHRWIRGDWQLLPWLGSLVPGAGGMRLPNRLALIDRWKILDNLRRSLLAPSLIVMLGAGWLMLPGSPWLWTVLGVLAPAGHLFTDLVTGFARGRRRSAVRPTLRRFVDHAGRWLLLVVFLPYEAWVAVDAIARTCARVFVTKQKLLEWTTAAHTAEILGRAMGRAVEWRAMWPGPLVAVGFGVMLGWSRPDALPSAGLLLLAWLVSPEVAYWLGFSRETPRPELDSEERLFLRRLARRTWLFYETFAGPEDQWLPPDNYQEDPGGVVAHRTSPTNIGMMFLASLAAWDLGYIGTGELASRLRNTLDTLKRLERYRGHFLNWYDTRSLEPLTPRYVSTVDSGNLTASLVAAKGGCIGIVEGPVFSAARWDGLVDVLALLETDVDRIGKQECRASLREMLRVMETHAESARDDPDQWVAALEVLAEREVPAFEGALREALEEADGDLEVSVLRDVRVWLDRVHYQIREMDQEIDTYAPWAPLVASAPGALSGFAKELRELLPLCLPGAEAPGRVAKARERVAELEVAARDEDAAWLEALSAALARGEAAVAELREALLERADEMETAAFAMDFRWLYDRASRLFHIGYNVSADRIDSHHYDLLASEARTASFMAIAKGDAPLEHWFHLGRSITNAGGNLCLVSWGGSMFEYLMPALLLRSERGTLLAQSECAAVAAQQRFASAEDLPWGVSESGYASVDADRNYRYRSFGVPGLGLRRGLAEDRVVAPYASVLALDCEAPGAVANLRKLAALGMLGEYGFFEAADFTPERVPEGRRMTPVRSYMAHHQGMILAALDNALRDGLLVRRMQADPRVRSVELLLHERIPAERPLERLPRMAPAEPPPKVLRPPVVGPWSPERGRRPAVHLLGNGRLSSTITDAGAGGLSWHDHALTRWSSDPSRETQGMWFYIKDEESGEQWPAIDARDTGGGEDAVVFHPHLAEFHRRHRDIALRMEIAVASADDVEIRRFTISNESDRARTLTLTSYAEVVLAAPQDDARHLAFSKLFVRSEWLSGLTGLLFTRRPRGPGEKPPVLLHRAIESAPGVAVIGFECDRRAFLGRRRDTRNPLGRVRSAADSTGFTLDTIASLCVRVDLEAGKSVQLGFVTLAAGSRESALETAERYQTMSALDWGITDSATEASRSLRRMGLTGDELPALQDLASFLLYPQRLARAAPEVLSGNRLGQPQLWGMGISGDLPILLVRTRDAKTELLRLLVRGHRFWRERGLAIDLVVLREGASGYTEAVEEHLLETLREIGARDQLGRRGGVHFVAGDQLPEGHRALLLAAARVVLDSGRGALDRQLAAMEAPAVELPRFTPSRWDPEQEATPPLERPGDLQFDNGFGGFSADGRDYVIFLPPGETTPTPWCNVLANEDFGCVVTEAGGGFTWAANSGENRLTPWTNDPVSDPVGEALYLRDEETGAVWTPTPEPAGAPVGHQIRHTAGVSEWRSNSSGLEQSLQVLVPPADPVKLIRLRLRNLWNRPRRLTATYYAEWVLGALRSQTAPFLVPEYDPSRGALLVRNPWVPEFAERVAFLASSAPPHGLTGDRAEFLGRGGTPRSPAALQRWGLSGRVRAGDDPCAALQVHVELGPDEEAELHFVLGQGADRAHGHELIRRWRNPAAIAPAFDRTQRFWDDQLSRVEVETPDAATDLMLNRWLLYQAMASRMFARSGFHQSGGAIGFRDQLQDALSLVHVAPERLRSHLLECAAHQFDAGDVLHWWHPPSGRGVRTRCSDDLLWLPYAAAHYVEATGDGSVLEEEVPFLEGPPLAAEEGERYGQFASGERRSLFEHCERALERGVSLGRHGLPRIGAGDWNDGMNRVGAHGLGESVWLGWFALAAIRGFADLCEGRGEAELADHWRRRSAELLRAVEGSGWDGAWYQRALDDDGRPWGSRHSEECRIDSIAQSWSVLSGAGREERARESLASAREALVNEDDRLIRLLWPPFDHTPRDPGYIKAYPPGVRENGGQYTHAAAWLGLAFARIGDPEGAARIFEIINPIGHALTREAAERYGVEPYVLAADVASVAPHVGRGGWTWYTGAAAWTWRLGIEGILGIQRIAGGVRVDPCMPPGWGGAVVRIRGDHGVLLISIEDPEGVGTGVATVEVDGTETDDPILSVPDDGSERRVTVRLGRGSRV